jgi:hypothetical protein
MTNLKDADRMVRSGTAAKRQRGKKGSQLMGTKRSRGGQVLLAVKHGGHVVKDKSAPAVDLAAKREDITLLQEAIPPSPAAPAVARRQAEEVVFETKFDYLFSDLTGNAAAHLPAEDPAAVVAGLKALGDAMVEAALAPGEDPLQATGNSIIPAVYTYWGQFIDHDLTANTDRKSEVSDVTSADLTPLDPAFVVENLKNLRQPTVNLDSVYGDGPTFDPSAPTQAGRMYDGIKLRVGNVAQGPGIPGDQIPPVGDDQRDLPRIGPLIDAGVIAAEDFPEELRSRPNFRNLPFIADARNDENLIIAQFHTAFLRFHNAMVDWVQANESSKYGHGDGSARRTFERAQQLTRWHYQWLVVHDFLRTMTTAGVVDDVLLGGTRHYGPRNLESYMPLEFSVAAYRFGHSMVRAAYDHNRNFGRPGAVIPNAAFDLLFAFTGSGSTRGPGGVVTLNPFLGGSEVLPFNWIIEWDRFTDKGSSVPDHFARKIDTNLAPPLRDMVNQANDTGLDAMIKAILKGLARRNLLRGYHLSIPTGQAVAEAMEIAPLTEAELRQNNSAALNQALEQNGFLQRTPLWYYVLKEAEVRANGNALGEVGSRIVCETIIGQLMFDPESYLNADGGWDPGKGASLPNGDLIVTIRDFLGFAGLIA